MTVGRAARDGSDRAISTVVDVSLSLLLISAAVGTLALPVGSPDTEPSRPDPAATVETLAAGTTSVTYTLDTSRVDSTKTRPDAAGTNRAERMRVAHGSYAELLAEAAVENATLEERPLSAASDGYERAVTTAIQNATLATGGRTRVSAVWTPYPGAPTRGVASAGSRPPSAAQVAAATMTVPSRFQSVRKRAVRAAERSGYAGVARLLARTTVAGWYPPAETRLALRGDYPVDALLRQRYRRTATILGTTVDSPLQAVEPRRANARLAAALARRYEQNLRARFDTPTAAAAAIRIDEVKVVVATW
ncbi:MAG: hypothetical protein ABEJ05_00700 [Haloglomus sp.]